MCRGVTSITSTYYLHVGYGGLYFARASMLAQPRPLDLCLDQEGNKLFALQQESKGLHVSHATAFIAGYMWF